MEITEYDRVCAADYAKAWAYARNPMYYNFDGIGGDCTNFASQCIYAGSKQMNMTPVLGWYYLSADNRTASWTGVEYLYNFLIGNVSLGPFGSQVSESGLEIGDIVQLGNIYGYYHTAVVSGFSGGVPLVCAHTADSCDRPLDSYVYELIRYVHIAGVRVRKDYKLGELKDLGVIKQSVNEE